MKDFEFETNVKIDAGLKDSYEVVVEGVDRYLEVNLIESNVEGVE